jgi:hypothetical protein
MTRDTDAGLTVDGDFVGYNLAQRPDNHVSWANLSEVYVVTTDKGPADDDVFLFLAGRPGTGGCMIPQESASPLLDRLMQLPDFDFEAFIRSMSSAENDRFLVWRRKA